MAHQRAPSAVSDLDDIWCHVATESAMPTRADRFIASITSPNGFTCCPQTLISDAAATICASASAVSLWGQFVIIYRIEDGDVVILHVFHGGRDIGAFFRQ